MHGHPPCLAPLWPEANEVNHLVLSAADLLPVLVHLVHAELGVLQHVRSRELDINIAGLAQKAAQEPSCTAPQ